jgi:lipopolysaccharide/colanic/teichoic acid biosynthesis glycosyltransferase
VVRETIPSEPMLHHEQAIKRSMDVVVSGVGLVLLAPAMVLIALLVRATSPGPALFRHRRVGRGGVEFEVLKFRSMRHVHRPVGPQVTAADDPRITVVGRFLRRFKLDELPQLWNVLKGEMSLVGPRPDVRGYADRLSGSDARILMFRPGITGPATLYFRDEERLLVDIRDRQDHYDHIVYPLKVRIDLENLEPWSLKRDLAYLAVTVIPRLDRRLKVIPSGSDLTPSVSRPEPEIGHAERRS